MSILTELQSRLAAAMGDLTALDMAFECATAFLPDGLLLAISRQDDAEAGRILREAMTAVLRSDIEDAMESEQDRAEANDWAAHAELICGLMPEGRAA